MAAVTVDKAYISSVVALLDRQAYLTYKAFENEGLKSVKGFYWIYTDLPLASFLAASTPAPPTKAGKGRHIDIAGRAQMHQGLRNVISGTGGEWWCIYNGKAGSLMYRVQSEFTSSSRNTGKLALDRDFSRDNFRIKYIKCDDSTHACGVPEDYSDLKDDLERVWRLEEGWPILCKT